MLAYLSRAKLLSIEFKGQIRLPVAHLKLLGFSTISALMVYPDVHDLIRDLIAARPSINVDMAWVVERWARELDKRVLQGRRDDIDRVIEGLVMEEKRLRGSVLP